MLSNNQGLVLVVEQNNRPLGFAYGQILQRTEYKPKKVGIINMIFIQENYRRRGIGTQLIRELCKYFVTEHVSHISLRYVVGNAEAETFWQHLGFTPIIHTAYTALKPLQKYVESK